MERTKLVFALTILGAWKFFVCEAEYCSGYTDEEGTYHAGFHCPLTGANSPEDLYCCGTEFEKYCCDTQSNSFLNGLDPAAVIGALLAMVIVLVVCVALCCCCCSCCIWNRHRNNKRGREVRYNNLDGTINTTTSTSIGPPSDVGGMHNHHQPPSPQNLPSTSGPPYNQHMSSPPMPQPMPQPYSTSSSQSYMGENQPYPPQNSYPPSKDGYPFEQHGTGYPPNSSPSMQPPPPYHDPHHVGAMPPFTTDQPLGFATPSAPPPQESLPFMTKM